MDMQADYGSSSPKWTKDKPVDFDLNSPKWTTGMQTVNCLDSPLMDCTVEKTVI